MIRTTVIMMFVAFVCLYAARDWYKSLCALIWMICIVEYASVPKTMFGIQGFSPWNIVLVFVVFFWLVNRKKEGLRWDISRQEAVPLVFYFVIVLVAFARMISDTAGITEYAALTGQSAPSNADLTSEFLINSVKWLIPAALVYDGCRTRERLKWTIWAILLCYLVLAIQTIKWMPISMLADGHASSERALRILGKQVGYHRVDLSMMLAGAFWAFIAVRPMVNHKLLRLSLPFLAGVCLLGQVLTGGRAGYATWAGIGLVFAALKWRRYLIYGPIVVLLLIALVPAVSDRFGQGFGGENIDTRSHSAGRALPEEGENDLYTITAGRIIAWPLVLDKIAERPLVGYGRRGMQRAGIAQELQVELGENFPHPHNAYLQFTLDNGIIGLTVLFVLFFKIAIEAVRLLRNSNIRDATATGGLALALILALCFASIGSQTFYPREGTVPMWVAMALVLRVSRQLARKRVEERRNTNGRLANES